MAKIYVNSTTYTTVLDGAGFCISDVEMKYAFGDAPTDEDCFTLNPRSQVNGLVGKILWAKAVLHDNVAVLSETEG